MRNLFEELQRMKNLMVYDKGSYIMEVSTSSQPNINKSSDKPATDKPAADKPEQNQDTKSSSEGGQKTADKNDCFFVKATGRFVVDVPTGSKAVENFIIELRKVVSANPEYQEALDSGTMYIRDITLQGFASNFYGGPVEPQFDNDYCKKWEIPPDRKYGGVCTQFEFKPFSGKKLPKSQYKGDQATNQKLARKRAENLFAVIKETLEKHGKTYGIKLDPTTEPKYIEGGSLYTKDNVDEYWRTLIATGKLNPGQIVAVTANVCYTLKEPCPDPCMEKDDSGNCKCPEGMTYNEETKQCECPPEQIKEGCLCKTKEKEPCPDCMERLEEDGECECKKGLYKVDGKCFCDKAGKKSPDENCECGCPKCMKRDENGECKCPDGMTYNEKTEKCDCPEGKIKPTEDACNCITPKPPIKCNQEYKKEGARGTKQNNFVAATVKSSFPAGAGDVITIAFDSLVVPDAFYVRYGDQEFFSGFMGDVYNTEYRQIALSIPERKKMLPLQSKTTKEKIKKSLADGDNDYSQMENIVRNFVGELIIYKREDGLLESINAAIKSEGGKLNVKDIFKNGDAEAEKITDDIINSGSIADNIGRYGSIMKSGASFKINKETENLELIVLAFSPLDRTIFNMQIKCSQE